MLTKQLRKEWRVREALGVFEDRPTFAPQGLILGAGTVLAKVGQSNDNEQRLEALLAVAYAVTLAPAFRSRFRLFERLLAEFACAR